MRIWEIITGSPARLDEMAFYKKAIVDKLRALQNQINSHALKIIVYPNSTNVPHWKTELMAFGNDLTEMQLRGVKGVKPMGFDLAWNGLYREPFEGAEERVLQLKLNRIEKQYKQVITKDSAQIIIELKTFLQSYCQAIGQSQPVDSVVNNFGK